MARTRQPKLTDRQTIRIPLVGEPFHRTDDPTGSTTDYIDDTIDQRFENCVFEKYTNPITGKDVTIVKTRPGLAANTTYANVLTQTCTSFELIQPLTGGYASLWRASADQSTLRLYVGASNSFTANLGNGATGLSYSSRIMPCSFNTAASECAFLAKGTGVDQKAFYFDGTTVNDITDSDLPVASASGNIVYKNGSLYVLVYTTGLAKLYNSDLNAPTAWGATSYIATASAIGSGTVALYKNNIVALCEQGIEFYEDIGNTTGSPLSHMMPIDISGYGVSATISAQVGPAQRVCSAYDTLFWVNNHQSKGGLGIYVMENFKPVKISSGTIDKYLATYTTPLQISIAGTGNMNGHRYVFVWMGASATSNDNKTMLAYDIDLKIWSFWRIALSAAMNSVLPLMTAFDAAVANSVLIVNADKDYAFGGDLDSVYTDAGTAYARTIQTRPIDLDTEKRKRCHKLAIIGLDARAASTTAISWSDNDYASFTTARNLDMNNLRTYMTNLGMFRKRAFRITNSANTPFELEALELDISLMGS